MKTFLQMEMYYVREYFKNLRLECILHCVKAGDSVKIYHAIGSIGEYH